MSAIPEPPGPPHAPPHPQRTGRLLLGILLVLFGLGWLLEVLDVIEFPWGVLLPSALILIGVALLITSRSGQRQGGLITAGVALTVVLAMGSALDIPFAGGVGDHDAHPATAGALRSEYTLGVGQLTIDLSDLSPTDFVAAEIRRIRAKVGIGELIVIVPSDLAVRVEAHAGLGDLRVFGREASGFDVNRDAGPDPATVTELDLVVSVGLGQVEVRRG